MKLIAIKDFARVPALAEIQIKNQIHSAHIHKGATFEIGAAPDLEGLGRADKRLVAQLFVSGCIGDATDPALVERVKLEVAAEVQREKNVAAANAATSRAANSRTFGALVASVAQ